MMPKLAVVRVDYLTHPQISQISQINSWFALLQHNLRNLRNLRKAVFLLTTRSSGEERA